MGFDYITSRIRRRLEVNAPDLIRLVFEPLDTGCMPFIDASALSDVEFKTFCTLMTEDFNIWLAESPDDQFPEYHELIAKMGNDARLNF